MHLKCHIAITTLVFVTFHSFATFMYSPMEIDDSDVATVSSADATFQLRSYQAEMVEASMKDNIIVVQDTGSGKTHM